MRRLKSLLLCTVDSTHLPDSLVCLANLSTEHPTGMTGCPCLAIHAEDMIGHHEARDDNAQPSNALEGQQASVEEPAQVILLGDAQQRQHMRRKEDEVPKADAQNHPLSYTGRLHMANLLVSGKAKPTSTPGESKLQHSAWH